MNDNQCSSTKKLKIDNTKSICRYGLECERQNPIHLIKYRHSHLEDILYNFDGDLKKATKYNIKNPLCVQQQLYLLKRYQIENKIPLLNLYHERFSFIEKEFSHFATINEQIEAASPFRFFLTMVLSSKETHNDPLSLTFYHLLDPSLGELQSSLHISFCVELEWLLKNYKRQGLSHTSMLIIYGVEDEDLLPEYLPNNIQSIYITPPNRYGTHHTKMSIFSYKDGSLRIMIGSANLDSSDWENRTQGIWVSPKLPLLQSNKKGESPTNFKADLIKYLLVYEKEELQIWLDKILNCDFSEINVFLIASVPGEHSTTSIINWGHRRLGNILHKHASHNSNNCKLVAQCSSIGSLGSSASSWLSGEFLRSFSEFNEENSEKQSSKIDIQVIYPSINNVKESYDGLDGGLCLPYSRKIHRQQIWLDNHFNQWKSDKKHRSRSIPHIKTYGLYSNDYEHLSWFILSSANLSKAAWGRLVPSPINCKISLHILSYECGVLFLPKFINSSKFFESNQLPIPYDLPLSQFQSDDHVWATDMFYK